MTTPDDERKALPPRPQPDFFDEDGWPYYSPETLRSYAAEAVRAALALQEPVLWWNGLRRTDERDGTYPSVSPTEDTWHDIPLYYGVNPCNLAAPAAAAQQEPVSNAVIDALNHAEDWIGHQPHGDNCFVSDHYEGDPGSRCNCGKDSALSSIQRAAEAPGLTRNEAGAIIAAPAAAAPADPMDWPLPCDVTVGHGTMLKGVRLGTLVARMKALYKMATGEDADEVAGRTLGERQAKFQALMERIEHEHAAPAEAPAPAQPAELGGHAMEWVGDLLFSAHWCGSSSYHCQRVRELLGPHADIAEEVIRREERRNAEYARALCAAPAPAQAEPDQPHVEKPHGPVSERFMTHYYGAKK